MGMKSLCKCGSIKQVLYTLSQLFIITTKALKSGAQSQKNNVPHPHRLFYMSFEFLHFFFFYFCSGIIFYGDSVSNLS